MTRSPRRFGLLDAMILIAAAAVGLGWSRYQATQPRALANPFGAMSELDAFELLAGRPVLAVLARIWRWFALSVPCVTTLAMGLLIVRLRKPRPRSGRIFLQPGAAACGAVAVAFCLEIVRFGIALLRWLEVQYAQQPGGPRVITNYDWQESLWDILHPEEHGIAVIAAWSALLLARRMRCERSAIDRLGRAVGVFWVVALILYWAAGEY